MTEPDEQEVRERFAEHDRESAESTERWIERMGLEGDEAEAFRDHGKHWILIDDEPVAVGLYEWGKWFEGPGRRTIALDDVQAPGGRIFCVSTVFLGLAYGYTLAGPPLLFETMIFDDIRINRRWRRWREGKSTSGPSAKHEDFQMRYATAAEARAGHALTVRMVKLGNEDWADD